MNSFQNRIISATLRFTHHALRIIFLFQQSVFIRGHPWFKLFLLMFLPGSFCLSAMAAPITFQSSETQTSLLELYTSEGCSSCPPAETWLSRLKESPGLWKDFVPVAFHVDYWDYLGWRDPWSSKTFILKVTSADLKNWDIIFSPTAPSDQAYEAHAALLASDLTSDIKAGENKGRRLEHDFVVINLVGTSLKPKAGTFTGSFTLDPKPQPGSHSLSIWITRLGQAESLQAAGGWLGSAR